MKGISRIKRKYFKSHKLFIFAILFTTIQGISEVILPRFMGEIVNKGIMTGDLDKVYSIGISMLIFTVLLGISGYFAFVLTNTAVLRFGHELRTDLYDKVTKLGYSEVHKMGGGSVITRLTSDVEKVVSVIKITIDLVYKPMLLAIGGFLMIFTINIKFGLVFLGFIVALILIVSIYIHKTSSMFMDVQKSVDSINTRMQRVLHGMRLIKASVTEEYEEKRFEEKNKDLYKRNIRVLTIMSSLNPIVMFIMNIAIVVIVIMIGYQAHDNSTSIGNVMMSITYAEQILMSIMISSNLARTISEIKPSVERLEGIMDAETAEEGTETLSSVEAIEFKNVWLEYTESVNVLKDISYKLSRGESLAVVGSTAGGKSSLALLAGGLVKATKGEVLINGKAIETYAPQELRKRIAVVGAYNNSIYSGTYLDNIILGREWISRTDAEEAAKNAEISDFIEQTDYGYASLAYASGNTVSGGQRQRLMIARALAGKPDVIILDDSTSSLDFATEKSVVENIRKNYKDSILILITERAGSVAICDRSCILKEGGLVDADTDDRR